MEVNLAIYGRIGDESSKSFVDSINGAVRFGNDIRVRLSTGGGDVMQGYAMLSVLKEFEGKKSVVVDGKAYSMGAFMCMYVSDVEAYNVSEFMIHRADYPSWFKNSDFFKDSDQKSLDNINDDLKVQMKKRLDADAWKSITGVTIDEVFDGEERVDYFLTAKEAKKVGLISKILTLDSQAKREINGFCKTANIAAMYNEEKKEEKTKTNKMTKEEFKKEDPEAYKDLCDEIRQDIQTNIEAWAEYKDVSPESVIEGISTMKAPNAKDFAKFAKMQMQGAQMTKEIENESPEASGQETAETGAEKEKKKVDLTEAVNALFE